MENKFEHNEPEAQNWKKYLPPVNPHKADQQPQQQNVSQDALCAWVCEQLSYLLDNDGSVRPEQAAGIHGHLALCRHCAQEWEELQNVVSLVENLPPMPLPRDFSELVMQRIMQQNAPLASHALTPQPVAETGERVQAVAAIRVKTASMQMEEHDTTARKAQKTSATTQTQDLQLQQVQTQQTQTRSQLLQRMSAGTVFSGLMAYFLSTAWGRQMLGAMGTNVNIVSTWLGQTADVLRSVPIVTWIFGLIFSALAQVDAMLSHTYHAMGTMAAVGLGMDVAVCAFAYMYLNARRRSAQMRL